MNKFITLILCLCCIFTSAWAEGDDHVSLNPSDANIVGHILDKKTGEHLSLSMSTSTVRRSVRLPTRPVIII